MLPICIMVNIAAITWHLHMKQTNGTKTNVFSYNRKELMSNYFVTKLPRRGDNFHNYGHALGQIKGFSAKIITASLWIQTPSNSYRLNNCGFLEWSGVFYPKTVSLHIVILTLMHSNWNTRIWTKHIQTQTALKSLTFLNFILLYVKRITNLLQ